MPQRRQATRRFLATVLFTDIVGSTERAADLTVHPLYGPLVAQMWVQ